MGGGAHLLGRAGQAIGGGTHLADDLRQLLHHVLHGFQQQARFVAGLDLDAHSEIALGQAVGNADSLLQRARDAAYDPDRDADGEDERRDAHGHHQGPGLLVVGGGFGALLIHQFALELDQIVDPFAVLIGRRPEAGLQEGARLLGLAFFGQLDDLVLHCDVLLTCFQNQLEQLLALGMDQHGFELFPGLADIVARLQDAFLGALKALLVGRQDQVARANADIIDARQSLLEQQDLGPLVTNDDIERALDVGKPGDADGGNGRQEQHHHAEADPQPRSDLHVLKHLSVSSSHFTMSRPRLTPDAARMLVLPARRLLHQGRYVHNQSHFAAAQDGGSRDPPQMAE